MLFRSIGCSLSQLYIGLDCNPKELNIPPEEVFYFDIGTPEENYKLSIDSNYEKCGILLTNYSSMDESFIIEFQYDGVNYDIESYHLTLDEVLMIVRSIIH